jgi:hypothetical protein
MNQAYYTMKTLSQKRSLDRKNKHTFASSKYGVKSLGFVNVPQHLLRIHVERGTL